MRILVVKLDGIGDVVLFTPFLRELRLLYPSAEIVVVTSPITAPLLDNCPYLDAVKVYDHKRARGPRFNTCRGQEAKRYESLIFRLNALCGLAGFIWKELWGRYDLAIVPRWAGDFYRAGWITFFSRSRRRITFAEKCAMGTAFSSWRDRLYTDVLTSSDYIHERDINLSLIEYLGGLVTRRKTELWFSKEDESNIVRLLANVNISFDNYITVCPGSIMPEKEWDVENYARVIQFIHQKHGVNVVLIGGPSEKDLCEGLTSRFPEGVCSVAGKTSLNETAILLEKSQLYVGNDTGTMHMAVAMNTPVVMVSCFPKDGDPRDLNSPARFGPCPEVSSVVVQPNKALDPCDRQCIAKKAHCINEVTVDEVCEAIDRIWASEAIGLEAEVSSHNP